MTTHVAIDGATGRVNPAQLRSDVYSLLAALLVRPPAARTLAGLAHLETLPATPAPIEAAVDDLSNAAAETDALTVEREYTDLFIGTGRGELVPYASWYHEKLLAASPLARLRRDLAALGIDRRDGVRESEDHAGALCETMVLIIPRPQLTIAKQADFFGAHIAGWMPRFFRDLRQARAAVFYRAVGRLGEDFLLLEQRLLQKHLGEED